MFSVKLIRFTSILKKSYGHMLIRISIKLHRLNEITISYPMATGELLPRG